MAWVSLRKFSWTTKTNVYGLPEVRDIKQISDRRKLPIDLSDVITTNALATTVSRPTAYRATLHELRLIGSYLNHGPGQQARLRGTELSASARHIRSFISESVGLGMLTATVQAVFRWYSRDHVHNMDALPTSLAGSYTRRGTRPDLLFEMPSSQLAGEARGRSKRAPNRALQEHRNRLNQLLPWADHHRHNLVMTWTYLTDDGVTVDWFMPETGLPNLDDRVGESLPPSAPGWPAMPTNINDTSRHDAIDNEADLRQQRVNDFDHMTPGEISTAARRRRDQIMRALFDTAPADELPIRVAGRHLRGTWVPLDLMGPSTGSLLLGVLDQPPRSMTDWEATDLLRQRMRQRLDIPQSRVNAAEAPLTVTVRDRLLVGVASEGFTPSWEWLADDPG
jgi:hypothetical protein